MVERNPGVAVETAVERCLALAATWLAWDGRPRLSVDGDRVYTPHKAIRRIADHLIDHLAEVEALLGGAASERDGWYGSTLTLAADWAPFTEADLVEARQRLRRLGRTVSLRLAAAGEQSWDEPREGHWTLRQIADHLTEITWYAEQVGDLTAG